MQDFDPTPGPRAVSRHHGAVLTALVTLVLGLLASPVSASVGGMVDVGDHPILALDGDGNPVILFRDSSDLRLLRCNDPACTGADDFNELLLEDVEGMAMVLDEQDHAVVFATTYDGWDAWFETVRCANPACSETQRGTPYYAEYTASSLAIALDAAGNPVLAYDDHELPLSVLRCGEPVCNPETWDNGWPDARATTPGNSPGEGLSLQIDAADNPVLSFRRDTDIVLLHCNDSDCAGDDDPASIVASGHEYLGSGTSLALDSSGHPVIAFGDANGIGVVHCNDPLCAGGDDVARRLGSGETGAPSLALRGNNPVVAYHGPGGVTLLHCNDPNCAGGGDTTRLLDAGWNPSLALDAAGNPAVAYRDDGTDYLLLLRCDNPICDPDGGGGGVPELTCDGKPATIVGTNGKDRLVGTNGPDVIVGLGGDDELIGYGGNDTLCGNDGNDRLVGHGGNDALFGGNDHDVLFGNAGNDRLYGDDGNDTIWAGSQDDQVFGGDGDDRLDGSGGNDHVVAGRGNDHVTGGSGVDLLLGGEHDDQVFGGGGNDTVRGNSGNDVLRGDGGNDDLDGGWGPADSADGGTGIDRCVAETRTTCES